MVELNDQVILNALRSVMDPELGKDLVTLNMIQDLKIQDGNVSFTIVLTTPACPLRNQIESDAKNAVLSLPGVKLVAVKMSANVPADKKLKAATVSPIKQSIAIASGKGGVGKSTVAVNLAIALAKAGAKVGLLDADIYGPNVPTMMGISQLPVPVDGKLEPAQAYGVKIMSIGFLVPPGQALIWRGPMLHSAIKQFISDVNWGELDYLVIDLPPGTGDAQLSLAQNLPLSGGIIVTLPQQVSVEDASRGLQMFQTLNIPILGVIENMSFLVLPDGSRMTVFGEGGGKQLALAAKVPFLGEIPMDSAVRAGGDEGKPIVISQPESAASIALVAIAEAIAAMLSVDAINSNTQGISVKVVE